MLELYVRENLPVSDQMLKLSFLFMTVSLPIMVLAQFVREACGKKKPEALDDPDMSTFIEEYYPETLEEVEQATVVLDTVPEIEGFLSRIGKVFDRNLDPLECARVLALAKCAQKDVERNCRAYVTYGGRRVPLIFKISREDNKTANVQIDIFTPCDVLDKIVLVMDEYLSELEHDATGLR